MKKWSLLFVIILVFSFALNAEAHSGRTDSSGGHNCSAKSVAKGLCTGYHYHNGGGSSAPKTSPSTTPKPQEPVYNPKVYYDNGYKAGYSKGIEMGYQKGEDSVESTDSNDDYIEGWTAGFDIGYTEGLEKKEAEEKAAKDKVEGAAKGKADGKIAYYAGKAVDAFTHEAQSSETYIKAYNEKFISSWETAKLAEACFEEGYNQGLKQDELVISKTCEEESLRSEFEKGHVKGVQERDTKEIEKLTKQGEAAGYEVAELVVPKEAKKPSYQAAFEKGYEDGKNKRKEEVESEGYDSAFKQVDFVNEVFTDNEVLSAWYKEGYESNEIAKEIKTNAQTLGEESDEYVIAEEYKVNDDSISLYDSLFTKGQGIKKEREREQRNLMLTVGAIGAPAAGGLYFWKRKRKNKAQ
ncbi:YHYH domain-containing protein [Planococcus sp. 1R117A]|uniref:YHYH domain-containing protein n=1 Tax=Planococcus sp. 1R117A TaxID=3447020 RepID=UPI003EDC9F78